MFENVDNLGQRIKIIRLKKGDTLKEFGERFVPHASHSLVSRWERNINKPNRERLEQIARLGNVSVTYLTTGVKTFYDLKDDELQEVFAKFTKNFKDKQLKRQGKLKEDLLAIVSTDEIEYDLNELLISVIDFTKISKPSEERLLAVILRQLNKYKDVYKSNDYSEEDKIAIKEDLLEGINVLVSYRLGEIEESETIKIIDGDNHD